MISAVPSPAGYLWFPDGEYLMRRGGCFDFMTTEHALINELIEALSECESWMRCECGHPACKRCRACDDARDVMKKSCLHVGREFVDYREVKPL